MIPVHLTGALADMPAIRVAARDTGAVVIEDAAHALGARQGGHPVGSCADSSDMSVFSFHPVKQITTGEGGAVTANDTELQRRLRRFRDHGMVREPAEMKHPSPGPWYYEQHVLGHNLRMTDIQAALGTSQLAKLDRFVSRRRALAALYDARLSELSAVRPSTPPERASESSYHLYCVLIDFDVLGIERKELMQGLRACGIGTQVHYIPLPMQPYYQDRGWRIEDFPGARRYYERTLSLPLFPGMRDSDVDRVVESLRQTLRELGGV